MNDQIAVYEYMNAEWWLGKNLRTGKEGVFPVAYVQPQVAPSPHIGAYGNEKAGYQAPYVPYQQQGPPPPGPSNPYNSSVPPMGVAEQPVESKPGKGQEMGKKFGKKLYVFPIVQPMRIQTNLIQWQCSYFRCWCNYWWQHCELDFLILLVIFLFCMHQAFFLSSVEIQSEKEFRRMLFGRVFGSSGLY